MRIAVENSTTIYPESMPLFAERLGPKISLPRITSSHFMSSDTLPPIYTIRGQRVMLDSDLAQLYQIATKAFNQAMVRNIDRFPIDFAFQLTREEVTNLKSQIVTSSLEGVQPESETHGGVRKLPWAFTEHGAIMAATILRSERAVAMSVYIVRAFVRMREELLTHAVILKRLALIDRKLMQHDVVLRDVIEKLTPLLTLPERPPKPKIGFHEGNR
jgi:hypothetical protein